MVGNREDRVSRYAAHLFDIEFCISSSKCNLLCDAVLSSLNGFQSINRDNINPADSRPVYRPIKCQILALFSSADKNKIITTLL